MDSPPYSPVWGGVFRHVNLLVPPKHPDAQMDWIIMEPEDTPPMSGSNSICVATVLLETGTHQHMLDPQDPWPQGYQVADTWPKI